ERGDLQDRRAADAAVGDQHGIAETLAIAMRFDRQGDTAQLGEAFLVFAAEGQRHQPGAGGQQLVSEAARDLIAEAAGAHAGNRQAAGGDHQRGAVEQPLRGLYAKTICAAFDVLYAAVGADLHAGGGTFVQQHSYDLLGGDIAEQLAQFFLVIGDAVPLDHVDEVGRRVAGQRRFAEVRIGREEIAGCGAGIGEVAATATGHQDLLADLVGMVDHLHQAAALAGGQGAHQAGGPGTDHQYVATGQRVSHGHSFHRALAPYRDEIQLLVVVEQLHLAILDQHAPAHRPLYLSAPAFDKADRQINHRKLVEAAQVAALFLPPDIGGVAAVVDDLHSAAAVAGLAHARLVRMAEVDPLFDVTGVVQLPQVRLLFAAQALAEFQPVLGIQGEGEQ